MPYEMDSDGNMISILEAFLGEKERKRTSQSVNETQMEPNEH